MTINDQLLRDRIRAALLSHKYANGVVRDVLAMLNDADSAMVGNLARALEETTSTWQDVRLQHALDEMGKANSANYSEAATLLKNEMSRYAQHESESAADGIAKLKPYVTGLPETVAQRIEAVFSTTALSESQLAAIASMEPIRIGADGRLLLEEIFQGLAAGKEKAIRAIVREGMAQSKGIPEITRWLVGTRANRYTDGILEVQRRNVEAMVRTIVIDTSNKAAAMTYQANADVVKGMLRLETLDKRTCSYCGGIDHTVVPLNSTQFAPFHIGCRGFTVPQLKSWQELGIPLKELPEGMRSSMNGLVPASTTYPQWLKDHPQYAAEVLGKSRAQLFLSGKLPISAFTNDRGRTLTLTELKEKLKS